MEVFLRLVAGDAGDAFEPGRLLADEAFQLTLLLRDPSLPLLDVAFELLDGRFLLVEQIELALKCKRYMDVNGIPKDFFGNPDRTAWVLTEFVRAGGFDTLAYIDRKRRQAQLPAITPEQQARIDARIAERRSERS